MSVNINKVNKGKLSDVWKTLQFFFSLDATQRKIVLKKQIEGEFIAEKWLGILDKLTSFDKYGDLARTFIYRWIRYLQWGSLAMGIAYLVVAGAIVETKFWEAFEYPFLWGWYLIILIFLNSIFLRLILSLFEGIDLPNTFRSFLIPLLAILKKETGEFDLISIKMDLRDNDNRRFKVKRDKNYKWVPHRVIPFTALSVCVCLITMGRIYPPTVHGYDFVMIGIIGLFITLFAWMFLASVLFGTNPKLITTFYQVPVLDISTKLSDGTLFRLEVVEDVIKKFVWRSRTNYRGKTKIKQKTKFKKKITVSVRLGFSNKMYHTTEEDTLWTSAKKTKFKTGEKRNVVGYRLVEKHTDKEGYPNLRKVLQTVSKGAYQNINLAE